MAPGRPRLRGLLDSGTGIYFARTHVSTSCGGPRSGESYEADHIHVNKKYLAAVSWEKHSLRSPMLSESREYPQTVHKRAYGKRGSTVLSKVNWLMPIFRQAIALHSPNALLEAGLRICPPEKSQNKVPFAAE